MFYQLGNAKLGKNTIFPPLICATCATKRLLHCNNSKCYNEGRDNKKA